MARPARHAALFLMLGAGVCGAFGTYRLLDARVGERIDAAAAIADRVRENDAVVARADAVEAERRRLRALLTPFAGTAAEGTAVARLVREAARRAAHEGAAVETVAVAAPVEASAVPGATHTAAAPPAVDVTVRGSYGSLLRAVRALADAPLAADIAVISIERAALRGDAQLTARIHVALHRPADLSLFLPPPPGEGYVHSRRP